MKTTVLFLFLLGITTGGCATQPAPTQDQVAGFSTDVSAGSVPSARQTAHEARILALQQERQQLLSTLGDFHDRIRDLESKLADRDGKPVAKSYDELLAIKETELSELRKALAENPKLAVQLNTTTNDLNEAKLQLAALEQQVVRKEQEAASLRGLGPVAAELDIAKRRLADLEAQLSQRELESRALRGSAAERESLAVQLQTVTGTLNHTKERLAAVEKQLGQKDQDLRSGIADKQKLTADLTAYSNELRNTRQRIIAMEQQAMEREQELNVVRKGMSDRNRLVNQLTAANMDLTQTKQTASNLERQLAAKIQEMEALRRGPTGQDRVAAQLPPRPDEVESQPLIKDRERANSSSQRSVPPPAETGNPKAGIATSPNQPLPSQPGAKHGTQAEPHLAQAGADLARLLQDEVTKGTISVTQQGNHLRLGLSSALLFQSGDADLKPDGINMLKRIGSVLGQIPNHAIQVAGHTDNQAIRQEVRKTFRDNKALSWARAENARRMLINGGMPAERIQAIGLGDTRPLAKNTTEAGRQKNRRIEIVVIRSATPLAAPKAILGNRNGPSMASLQAR